MTNLPPKVTEPLELAHISKNMVAEIFRFIEKKREDKGDKFAEELALQVLASLVGAMVYRSLGVDTGTKPGESIQKEFEAIRDSFLEARRDIENSVAAGFTGAMTEVTKKSIEYYAQVKVVPEVANKQPC